MDRINRQERSVMKKEYIAPRAEKLEFDYVNAVVASSGASVFCRFRINDKGNQKGCSKNPIYNDIP